MENIAKHVKLSSRQLNRTFQKHLSHPVKQVILSIKHKIARDLLINTNYNLLEIASRTGFSGEHSFIVSFKRKTGVTPNPYRKEHLNDKRNTDQT